MSEGSTVFTGTLLAESLRTDADLTGVDLDVRRIRRGRAEAEAHARSVGVPESQIDWPE